MQHGLSASRNDHTGRFVAERDDDHADRTWALFLAINAASGPVQEYGYTPVALPGASTAARRGGGNFMRPDHDDDYMPSGSGWSGPLGARLRGGI